MKFHFKIGFLPLVRIVDVNVKASQSFRQPQIINRIQSTEQFHYHLKLHMSLLQLRRVEDMLSREWLF